jgi:hypothetical protein
MNAPYIPDVGDVFTVTDAWTYRRWQWAPFPRYRRRVYTETHHYRVTGWMRRRLPRPEPRDEREALTRQIIDEMLADGRLEPQRGAGPDRVPLEWCHREEAEYVEGAGVGGTIQRVADVTVTGRVSWDEKTIQEYRDHADSLAGEPLI